MKREKEKRRGEVKGRREGIEGGEGKDLRLVVVP